MRITISGQAHEWGVAPYGATAELGEPEWRTRGAAGKQAVYDVPREVAARVAAHFRSMAAELKNGDLRDRAAGRVLALAADRIADQITGEDKRLRVLGTERTKREMRRR